VESAVSGGEAMSDDPRKASAELYRALYSSVAVIGEACGRLREQMERDDISGKETKLMLRDIKASLEKVGLAVEDFEVSNSGLREH
jgi:hypothetical protein